MCPPPRHTPQHNTRGVCAPIPRPTPPFAGGRARDRVFYEWSNGVRRLFLNRGAKIKRGLRLRSFTAGSRRHDSASYDPAYDCAEPAWSGLSRGKAALSKKRIATCNWAAQRSNFRPAFQPSDSVPVGLLDNFGGRKQYFPRYTVN